MTRLRHVEVELDQVGHGKVLVDGTDLSGVVHAIQINSEVGQVSQVMLKARAAHGPITIDGEVIQREGGVDSIVAFLQGVDAVALEAEAMEMLQGLDGSIQSPSVAFLATLQKWAIESADDGT